MHTKRTNYENAQDARYGFVVSEAGIGAARLTALNSVRGTGRS